MDDLVTRSANPAESSALDRLGSHVSGSLEKTRAATDAASRVRARLARGDGMRPLAERPTLRVRRGALLGALALAATLLVFAFGVWRESHRALTFVVGDGRQAASEGAFLAAPPAAALPVSFSDGTRVAVSPGSRARIAEVTARGARVLVESGVVSANVVHRADTRWLVDAGPFEVKVTGTRFNVAWQPAEQAVVVTLHEGSVVVTGCGLADGQRVSRGQQLHASCKTGAATLGPIAANTTIAPATAAEGTASNATATLTTATATTANAPGAVPTVERAATTAMALPDAPAARSANVDAATTAGSSTSASASASGRAPPNAERAATGTELLAKATSERYAGHFDGASDALATVRERFPRSEAAATAAFELGRIAFDARHDFSGAGDWFDTYLRERPYGALAREALGRDLEARHRAGDAARASTLASRYLGLYPEGPHATLARRLASPHGGDEGSP